MQEVKITKCIVNERNEVQIYLLVKQWDYKASELELLKQAKINWDLLDLEFTGFVKGNETEQTKKNLWILDMYMKRFCEEFWEDYTIHLKKFYEYNKIQSRTELAPEKVEEYISSYRISCNTWIK